MRVAVIRAIAYHFVAAFAVVTVCQPASAGLYTLDEPCPFKILEDGTAEELPANPSVSNSFLLHYAYAGNLGDDKPRKGGNPDRTKALNRCKTPLPQDASIVVMATRAADLIRTQQEGPAIDLLAPLARRQDYRIQANLAHAFAYRREWRQALYYHSLVQEMEIPGDLAGTTPPQRAWLQNVERTWYKRWLELHVKEKEEKLPPEAEPVFELFTGPPPKDAIAIVQQLLLWLPQDHRLYWLLAELYWKTGRVHHANRMFDSLVSEDRKQSNRTLLRAHRNAVKQDLANAPSEAKAEVDDATFTEPDARPWYEQMGLSLTWLIASLAIFFLVAVPLCLYQVRKWLRPFRRSRP